MVQKMQNKNFERLSEGFKALHLSVNDGQVPSTAVEVEQGI